MTGAEIISHALTFISGAAPTAALLVRERAKKQTAEAQALQGAVAMAQAALAEAQDAKNDIAKCKVERESDQALHRRDREECDRRTRSIYEEMQRLRRELEASGTITKSDPDRKVPPEVVEAWNSTMVPHTGTEPHYDEPVDAD